MFDTLQQGAKSAVAPGVASNGGSFAQKQQMRANPMMRARPAMSGTFSKPNMQRQTQSQQPNPMNNGLMSAVNQNAGMGGSRAQIQARQLAEKQKQAAAGGNQILSAVGSPIGGTMAGPAPANGVQSGLAALQTPHDQQQQVQPMNAMQAAQEQMRGYEGPDLGSQDPRELARMGQMGQLQGSVGQALQPGLQNVPFEGMQPGNPSFQSMLEQMSTSRPDIVRGGLSPSFGQPMQDNGMEMRRSAR